MVVKIKSIFDQEELLCPRCGCGALHQDDVDVYTRFEDGDGLHTHVDQDNRVATVDQNMEGNPSARRNGLTIDFWCEQCLIADDDPKTMRRNRYRLYISQHKGHTYISFHEVQPNIVHTISDDDDV